MPWSKIQTTLVEPDCLHECQENERRIPYSEAIKEGLHQALTIDPAVYVMGQGVDDPSGMFGTTKSLKEEFGGKRVFDTPLSEASLTGIAIGSALNGMRPVYFHNRPDFLLLAMDQIVNHASKWHFMFGGRANVPLVIWACIGRGWGSAAQHSQALQGLFFHIPGIRLIMPSSCRDAKGLMIAAIKDNNPVVIIDHRFNFRQKGFVPEKMYTVPIGKGVVRKPGKDVTLVAISHLVMDALFVAEELSQLGIEVEVIDPRSLRPLDEDLILQSVAKTGRLVITDTGWKTGGVAAGISSIIAEKGFDYLKAPIVTVASPDVPTPAGCLLEETFYFGQTEIKEAVLKVIHFNN